MLPPDDTPGLNVSLETNKHILGPACGKKGVRYKTMINTSCFPHLEANMASEVQILKISEE